MLEWVRGDKNNLLGRVLVYGINLDSSSDVKYPAVLAAADIEQILKLHKEEISQFKKDELQKTLGEIESKIKELMKKLDIPEDKFVAIKLDAKPIIPHQLYQEEDIQNFDCDVLKTEIIDISHGKLMMFGAAALYLGKYELQQSKKIKTNSTYVSTLPAFGEMPRADFKQHLIQLTGQLLYKLAGGESTDPVFVDLKQLAQGSPFMNDILNFYNLARTEHPSRIKLMELYIQKIYSVLDEKYEEVPELIKKIEDLTQNGP